MSDTSRREAINVTLAQLLPYWMDEVDAGHARKMLLDGIDQALEKDEAEEWEYGVINPGTGRIVNNGDYRILQTFRRRKAGPWLPIAPEDVTPYRPDGDQP